MRAIWALPCAAAPLFWTLLCACGDPPNCDYRGGPDTYSGSESYTGTVASPDAGSAGQGIQVAYPSTITVDWDVYTERGNGENHVACVVQDVAITITSTTCTLHATVTSVLYESTGRDEHVGPLNSAAARIDSGLCALPSGATLNVTSGAIAWNNLQTLKIDAAGTATSNDGKSGYLTMSFNGIVNTVNGSPR